MVANSCLVFFGNSVFLAGIKVELQKLVALELTTVEVESPDVLDLIRSNNPRTVLFDLTMPQMGIAIALMRAQPNLQLIGLDPSSNEMLVFSGLPAQALHMSDLIDVINRKDIDKT
ncbi:MAG: hypothetical protein WCK35_04240 [Chloroflexota bacterium]